MWNQLVLLHNPKNSFDTKNGFLIIQIKNVDRQFPVSQTSIPMRYLIPYRSVPIRIEGTNKENKSSQFFVLLDITLEVPITAADDDIVAVPLNWVQF